MAIVLKWTPHCVVFVCFLIATFWVRVSRAGNNSLTPNGIRCVCPGEALRFTCSILGGGTTMWSGSTLNCVENGVITLRHTSDNFQPGTFDYCNGDITSEIVGIEGNCYISRVNFTAMARFNDTSIDCSFQDPIRSSVGNSTIFIPASDYLQELTGFMVLFINMTEITFNWTEVNSLCSGSGSISYDVSSNCSSIICTTRRNEATCSNLPIATMCSFSISSSVCGEMETIAMNNAITVTLRRPQVNIAPVYSPRIPSTLTKVIITIYPEPFLSIAGDGPSPVTSYSFSYSNLKVNLPACQDPEVMCQHSIEFTCPPSAEIDVTLSASNILGRGPSTDPTTIACTNEFVRVDYDSATSTITCSFMDEMDASIKSCVLRQCDQMLASGHGQNSTEEAPNSIALNVATGDSNCFLVTASSNSFRITVEIRTSMDAGNANTGAVIGISISVIGVILMVIISVVIIVAIVMKKKPTTETNMCDDQLQWKEVNLSETFAMLDQGESEKLTGKGKIIAQFKLQGVQVKDIRLIDVLKDCQLQELTEDVKSELKIGRSFYEYQGELEDVPESSEVILMDEISRELFTSNITSLKKNRRFTDSLMNLKKLLEGFKIFVESFECDKNLKEGTSVIYKVPKTESNTANESSAGVATTSDTESATESATESNTKDATEVKAECTPEKNAEDATATTQLIAD